MIKNLRFYRIHSDWPADEASVSQQLENSAFKPCPAFAERSLGFEPPVENAGDLLCRRLAGCDLLQLRFQSRVLPAAAVKEALTERLADFKKRTLRDPSRKEKRELKEEVYDELLPRALLKSDHIRAIYFLKENILAVATPSANTAERLLDSLREALGSLKATPLEYKKPVSLLMSQVFLGGGPREFVLGRECRMKDLSDPKSTVNWLDMDLADASVRTHVKSGLSVDRLGMRFDAVLGFTVDEELVIRKLRLEGIDDADELPEEDPIARHDAQYTVLTGYLSKLVGALHRHLGGYAS
ncbi:MAG: recombination-associated protein RdgC [Gammaproteobacteria bacterium]|nr:recombination-associated protein RdgC [Gammaproteobacteria bacterium]